MNTAELMGDLNMPHGGGWADEATMAFLDHHAEIVRKHYNANWEQAMELGSYPDYHENRASYPDHIAWLLSLCVYGTDDVRKAELNADDPHCAAMLRSARMWVAVMTEVWANV